MPAIFTHIQFGKEVIPLLPPALQALAEKHPACFYLGTQGPDLLFYHKPMKKKEKNPSRKKGWDLHEISPEEFFLRAAKLLLPKQNEEHFGASSPLAAYLLGFLCHFTLDSTCHPMIDEYSVNGLTHGKIESELDKFTFNRIGQPKRGFNGATLFFDEGDAEYASAAILDVPITDTRRAMRSMRKINRLFSHPSEGIHVCCHAILTVAGMNGSFGEMFLHKKDDERCKDLLPRIQAKFDEAKQKAAEKIPTFFENLQNNVALGDLQDEFYLYNYSGIIKN